MEIKFIRAIQFTRLVKAGGRLREFNFRKLNSADTERFSINVVDDRGERILFQMAKQEGGWKLPAQQLPVWIEQNEKQLHQLIEEELPDNR